MKILNLIDTLNDHDSARHLQTLASAVADELTHVGVCCLGPESPRSLALRRTNVSVQALGWTGWFDARVVWRLRSLLRELQPDLVHVWKPAALRLLGIFAPSWLPRAVVSAPLLAKSTFGWWDRWLLARVGCVAVTHEAEAKRCLEAGLDSRSIRIVPSAVALAVETAKPEPLTVVCPGPLEREAGCREAVWAFDIVRHRFAELTLRMSGDGSQHAALRSLATGLDLASRLQLSGSNADSADALRRAAIVWIPSMSDTGRHIALEAMAHGRAVIAFAAPCLRDVIIDGETGYLVPTGDVVRLARHTRDLLLDLAQRQRLADAARRQVQTRWPLARTVAHWRELYRSLASPGVRYSESQGSKQ